jgi:hypothetical protein
MTLCIQQKICSKRQSQVLHTSSYQRTVSSELQGHLQTSQSNYLRKDNQPVHCTFSKTYPGSDGQSRSQLLQRAHLVLGQGLCWEQVQRTGLTGVLILEAVLRLVALLDRLENRYVVAERFATGSRGGNDHVAATHCCVDGLCLQTESVVMRKLIL